MSLNTRTAISVAPTTASASASGAHTRNSSTEFLTAAEMRGSVVRPALRSSASTHRSTAPTAAGPVPLIMSSFPTPLSSVPSALGSATLPVGDVRPLVVAAPPGNASGMHMPGMHTPGMSVFTSSSQPSPQLHPEPALLGAESQHVQALESQRAQALESQRESGVGVKSASPTNAEESRTQAIELTFVNQRTQNSESQLALDSLPHAVAEALLSDVSSVTSSYGMPY